MGGEGRIVCLSWVLNAIIVVRGKKIKVKYMEYFKKARSRV